MQGNLNALGIISCILFTIAVVIVFGRLKNIRQKGILVPVVLFAGLFLFFFLTVPAISTSRSSPAHQMAIPLLCIYALLLTVNKKGCLLTSIGIIIIIMIFLVGHYEQLIDSGKYTFGMDHYKQATEKHSIYIIRDIFENSAIDMDKEYPPGWADKSLVKIEQLEHGFFDEMTSSKDVRQWHTWLTGLYAAEKLYLWYPGGKIIDCFDKLEFRERPENMAGQ